VVSLSRRSYSAVKARAAALTSGAPKTPLTTASRSAPAAPLRREPRPPAWAGQTSVTGAGASSALNLAVTGGQTTPEGDAFFPNFLITSFLLDNISQNLPFTTVDPALQFDDVMNNVVYATPAQIGPVNGGSSFIPGVGLVASGPSIIFQTDPNGPIDGRSLPEPGSLLLLGMGLAALRAGKSRKA